MIKCRYCQYRKDNTCLKKIYEHGPYKGKPVVIYVKNMNHPKEVVIKTRPRWCPLKHSIKSED